MRISIMKKIIIHLGLPKTATTTLQHNLFQALHDEGKINFLGKALNYDERSGEVESINYTGKIIRDAAEQKIKITEAKIKIDDLLVNDKLNVFSDEGLMVAYPGKVNLSIANKIENLEMLLSDYEVTILFFLRQPVDYFYSIYVQLHPEFYSLYSKWDTFEKFSYFYFKHQKNILFESFDYEKTLSTISASFDVNVLLYEDLIHDKAYYYSEVANLLSVNEGDVRSLIEGNHLNKKVKSLSGTKKLYSLKKFEKTSRDILLDNPLLFAVFKSCYYRSGLNKLFNNKFYIGKKIHKIPCGHDLKQLEEKLLLNKQFPFDHFEIHRGKCQNYGYILHGSNK